MSGYFCPYERMRLEAPPNVRTELLDHVNDDSCFDLCMAYVYDRQLRMLYAASGDTRRPSDSSNAALYKVERYYGEYYGLYLARVRREVRMHRATRYAAYDKPPATMTAVSAVTLLLSPEWKPVADAIVADRLAEINADIAGEDPTAVDTPMLDLIDAIAEHEPVCFPAGVLVETIEFYAARHQMPRRLNEWSLIDQVAARREFYLAFRMERDMQNLDSCCLGSTLLHPISVVMRGIIESNFTAWCWDDDGNCLRSIMEHDENCQHGQGRFRPARDLQK